MSAEENKALARRFSEEVVNKGNLDAIDQLYAPNYVLHNPPPDVTPDLQGMKQLLTAFFAAFPDLHSTVEDLIAEGDKVVARYTVRGTHKGELMGIAATGKQVTITGISISRIVDGKIAEEWTVDDMLGLMQQLGVVPPPGQPGE